MSRSSAAHRDLPIGVFDSGVGGLTVAAALMQRLPSESILYLGDTARLPYGTKSPQTVRRYTEKNVRFLLDRGVKAVVVACNTASALGLDDFVAPVPVWGVIEPGARAAVAVTRGKVGVIATESTVRSDAYGRALRRLRPDLEVESLACPLFVPLVEEGWIEDSIVDMVAIRYLNPLEDRKIDTLVLGCTHYPLLKPVIWKVFGSMVRMVDSAETIARKVEEELRGRDLLATDAEARHHFCVTDDSERFHRIANLLLERSLPTPRAFSLEWVEI